VSRLLYADTGAFIAFMCERDRWHTLVAGHLRTVRAAGDRLVTSEPAIAETVTWLRYDAGPSPVRSFRNLLERSAAQGSLVIHESDERLRRAAFAMIEKFGDQRISYADAMGAVIAGERRVVAVFGLDRHFRMIGFDLEP
jgi:predicted nucleic acid-binding protein